VFHRIYEAMALGMHPASLYPRRNRDAPDEVWSNGLNSRSDELILRREEDGVKCFIPLKLCGSMGLTSVHADTHNASAPPAQQYVLIP